MSYKTCWLVLSLVLLATTARADAPVSVEHVDVVLDPGHGGSNTGSPGRGDVLEKRVTLALAKAVRQRLLAVGVSVQLTRSHDEYVPIRARARLANALQPRCFVSIHTNASLDHSHRGVETYALSRDAVDIRAHRAAIEAGSDVDAVIADLRAIGTAEASVKLADLVQRHMLDAHDGVYAPMDRGVRQAAHDVLADAGVPAILVETGFLDHPVEGRILASGDGQAAVADRLARGILAYLGHEPPPGALRAER